MGRGAVAIAIACGLGAGCCKSRDSDSGPASRASATGAGVPATAAGGTKAVPASAAMPSDTKVVFLHHSTGGNIWNGGVPRWIDAYNGRKGTKYVVTEIAYPHDPYPWENYPYDYWNIWVRHAGPQPFKGQETLEMLTPRYQVIVFKHCYPVSGLEPESAPDVTSRAKTVASYKAQYAALKGKLRSFASTRFIVWTGAALTRGAMHGDYGGSDETARRAKQFFDWVKSSWDEKGDNIFVFDFYALETEGALYMKDQFAAGATDPHPNEAFSRKVAPWFAQRIVDVVEGRGDAAKLTGQP